MCVCVYVCVCAYVHVCVCAYVCMYVYVCVYAYGICVLSSQYCYQKGFLLPDQKAIDAKVGKPAHEQLPLDGNPETVAAQRASVFTPDEHRKLTTLYDFGSHRSGHGAAYAHSPYVSGRSLAYSDHMELSKSRLSQINNVEVESAVGVVTGQHRRDSSRSLSQSPSYRASLVESAGGGGGGGGGGGVRQVLMDRPSLSYTLQQKRTSPRSHYSPNASPNNNNSGAIHVNASGSASALVLSVSSPSGNSLRIGQSSAAGGFGYGDNGVELVTRSLESPHSAYHHARVRSAPISPHSPLVAASAPSISISSAHSPAVVNASDSPPAHAYFLSMRLQQPRHRSPDSSPYLMRPNEHGWAEFRSPRGVPYWHNNRTGESTWNRPAPP